MIVALSYIFAVIMTLALAIVLYPIAAMFWCMGLFGKIATGMFQFTKNVISALWRDINNMGNSPAAAAPAATNEAVPPAFAYAPSVDLWTCSCGCVNSGKFCPECGASSTVSAGASEVEAVAEEA